jgi:hypothetical protein
MKGNFVGINNFLWQTNAILFIDILMNYMWFWNRLLSKKICWLLKYLKASKSISFSNNCRHVLVKQSQTEKLFTSNSHWRMRMISETVIPVYNDHPRDPKFVAVVDRWLLFRGSFMLYKMKTGPQNGGRYRQVVVIRRWSLTQFWLNRAERYMILGLERRTTKMSLLFHQ